ncbi:MAG: hypothetical protein H0X66_13225 [Verrucomicrobia bacterium]|nr:hypothetical protein [Verrucomicrobiota bacterium]
MQLSTLSILLGLAVAVPNLIGILKPAQYADTLRKFPRNTTVGYLLMLAATAWFVLNVYNENIADFEPMKPYLIMLFLAVGVGACIFIKDFLSVRGAAILMLLLAKLMVDTARWADSDWRLVIVTWAYVMIIAGIWFTVAPWRVRDIINWSVANEKRTRLFSIVRFAFGVIVLLLGITVFR